VRTITLELLRHGDAHNQLLSPLTPYLALCENHSAVTLHVPFEHNQFLHRLNALSYKLGNEARIFQLGDTAKAMGSILAEIPGLTAEARKTDHEREAVTHLRLIISASELALLPFELAIAPNGFPGAGQHLLLQPEMPVCLTREIRRAPTEQIEWPIRPRILFAAAAPPSVGPIPLRSHLLALRRVIAPWVRYYDAANVDMRRKQVEEHLVFLPSASIETIEQYCSWGNFTHIHILAHGVERRENYDTRFFLALHKHLYPDETQYINGTQLATALRASQRPDGPSLARPVLVTLATCNSANGGSVAGAGSSIAHAVHEAGIPIVVAGQFPLSFEGSVRLTEILYEGVLWGADPRQLMLDVRRRLYGQFPDRHDWASVTAYASLPANFAQQLSRIRIEQAMGSINAAIDYADEVTRRARMTSASSRSSTINGLTEAEAKTLLSNAQKKIFGATTRLERLVDILPNERPRIYGLLASTAKRHAEVLFSTATMLEQFQKLTEEYTLGTRANHKEASVGLLRTAREHYWTTFMLDRTQSWAVVQYLSLTMVLTHTQDSVDAQHMVQEIENVRPERAMGTLWSLARALSLYDLKSSDRTTVIWAHANLMELFLLSLVMSSYLLAADAVNAKQEALEHTDAFIDAVTRDLPQIYASQMYSTWQQINRYVAWYSIIADLKPLKTVAKIIIERLPKEVGERANRWKPR
jgi:hypothetical protein